jgi:hypothetical protein
MKKIITLVLVFIVSLFYFGVSSLPLAKVLPMLQVPKDMTLTEPKGTIFAGFFEEITYKKWTIKNVNVSVNFIDLFLLKIALNLNATLHGGYLEGTISSKNKEIEISNLKYENKVQNILTYYNLDMIEATGRALFVFKKIKISNNNLKYINGNIEILPLYIESPAKLLLGDMHIGFTTKNDKIRVSTKSQSAQVNVIGNSIMNLNKKTYKTQIEIKTKNKLDPQLDSVLSLFAKKQSDKGFIFNKKGTF